MRSIVLGVCLVLLFAGAAGAQEQIKGRVMVMIDTSESMMWHFTDDLTTGGDSDGTALFSDVFQSGKTYYPGTSLNGKPDGMNSRLYGAKKALTNAVSSTGDIDFGLMRYAVYESCDDPTFNCCLLGKGACICQKDYFDNPSSATPGMGTQCMNGAAGRITWKGGCGNVLGGVAVDGGQILVLPSSQSALPVLSWIDQVEDFSPATSGGFPKNPELRANGATPLAGSARTALGRWYQPILNYTRANPKCDPSTTALCDPQINCRPYTLVLMTDGGDTCDGDAIGGPPGAVDALYKLNPANPVKTYVIGLAITNQTDKQVMDAMAAAGHTGKARYAAKQGEIESAFADVVAASIKVELCNGLDDNCNGLTDEGFDKGAKCAAGIGACLRTGIKKCSANGLGTQCCLDDGKPDGACVAVMPGTPTKEICNGIDDDCNGIVDDGGPNGGSVCMSCNPVSETCNGIDDDCDGITDNHLTDSGLNCGLSVGACQPGTTACQAAMGRPFPDSSDHVACLGGRGPTPETCNNIDDDCDGVTDGITRTCYDGAQGTDANPPCRDGQQLCTGGMWGACVGEVLPRMEVCNNIDDDCNGKTDDVMGTGGSCCPSGKCGTGQCAAGALLCSGGGIISCVGAVGPSLEVCDGIDNDCNGKTDDLPGLGGICQPAAGCSGTLYCDPQKKMVLCKPVGMVMPEICNGIDEDCDGVTDDPVDVAKNDPRIGQPCGNAMMLPGPCKAGTTGCKSGNVVCTGEVSPSVEICDGIDNDCNGIVDDHASCPAGFACHVGGCYSKCQHSGEFAVCPGGYACDKDDFCIPDTCKCKTCSEVCRDAMCVDACAAAGCGIGQKCVCGACQDDSCLTRPERCATGQLCDKVHRACIADPCAGVSCPSPRYCDNGRCVSSCLGVACQPAETCQQGVCVNDRCASVTCVEGQTCDPMKGTCIKNPCFGRDCVSGFLCVSGTCIQDPCQTLHCPAATLCKVSPLYGTTNCEAIRVPPKDEVVTGGGGGFGCSAGARPESSTGELALFVLALLAFASRRRIAAALLGLLLGGCDPNPYCLNCGESLVADGGGVDVDALFAAADGAGDALLIPIDGPGDGAALGDSLSALTDSKPSCGDTESDPHNCGACGKECVYAHAFGTCAGGACAMGACQPGYVDLDKDPTNGCEYQCTPMAPPTEICDNKDDNCDGHTDEGFNLQTDPKNCGVCGNICNYPNTVQTCVKGACTISNCMPGYADADHNPATGCEYMCPVFPPVPEVCNGKDDDCDGIIDDNLTDVGTICSDTCPMPNPCLAAGNCTARLSTCPNGCCGACTPGRTVCGGGMKACQMGVGPQLEVCNGVDDNCDGQIDEGFDLARDPTNCGQCGHTCLPANGVGGCAAGRCTVVACKPGYADVDKDPGNGCEYTCPVNPPTVESCNGKDDDCNGLTDDNLSQPSNFCNQSSICKGSVPACAGIKGWLCNYLQNNPHIEVDGAGNLALTEKLCDGQDGNCNGLTDESFPNKGKPCYAGIGACQGTMPFGCKADMSGTECLAQPNAGAAVDELCNGVDDNCDGLTDERKPVSGSLCYNGGKHACVGAMDAMVNVGTTYIYKYEASRPDATGSQVGTLGARACSKPGVLPWSPVTQAAAATACGAIKDSTGAPLRLCDAAEWTTACNLGMAASPIWSFATNPTVYASNKSTCNGIDANLGKPWPTGSGANCYADQKAAGPIFDLSGNVGEWTSTLVTVGVQTYYKVRGGAYNNFALGTNCDFDFTIDQPGYEQSDLGFRCCADHAP